MRKGKWLLMVVAVLAGLAVATSAAYADGSKAKSETKTAGKVQVELITEDGPAVVGDNNVAVQLTDTATGQPIVRDSVRLELTMDNAGKPMQGHNHSMDMSSQRPIILNLKASPALPGRYDGKLNFTDPGAWNARVVLGPNPLQDAATFAVRVEKPSSGPNWLIIGGFLAVLAGGGGLVYVIKARSGEASVPRRATRTARS